MHAPTHGTFTGVVTDRLAPTRFAQRYRLHTAHNGDWLLQLPKTQAAPPFGRVIVLKGSELGLSMDFATRRWLDSQGLAGILVPAGAWVLKPDANVCWHGMWASWRFGLADWLDAQLHGGPRGALGRALLLGDRSGLAADVRHTFRDSGTAHLLAISGLHISLLLVALQAALRWLGLQRWRKHLWQWPLLVILLYAYTLLAGDGAPLLRALIGGAWVCAARLLDRKVNGLQLLSLTLLTHVLLFPRDVTNLGFLLSYSAVFGLIAVAPWLTQYQLLGARWHWLWQATAVTLVAQVYTLPVSLYAFGQLPVWFLATNLVLVPLTTAATALLFLLLLVGWLPGVSVVLAAVSALLLDATLWLGRWFAQWPGSMLTVTQAPLWVALLLGAVLWLLGILAAQRSAENHSLDIF